MPIEAARLRLESHDEFHGASGSWSGVRNIIPQPHWSCPDAQCCVPEPHLWSHDGQEQGEVHRRCAPEEASSRANVKEVLIYKQANVLFDVQGRQFDIEQDPSRGRCGDLLDVRVSQYLAAGSLDPLEPQYHSGTIPKPTVNDVIFLLVLSIVEDPASDFSSLQCVSERHSTVVSFYHRVFKSSCSLVILIDHSLRISFLRRTPDAAELHSFLSGAMSHNPLFAPCRLSKNR